MTHSRMTASYDSESLAIDQSYISMLYCVRACLQQSLVTWIYDNTNKKALLARALRKHSAILSSE